MDPSQRELLLRAIAEATGGEDAADVTPDLPEKRYRVERVTQAAVRPLSPAGAVAGSRVAYVDGGNAEIIQDKENGLLVAYNGKNDIKGAIEILLTDSGLYSKLSENGIKTAKQFTKKRMIDELIKFISV